MPAPIDPGAWAPRWRWGRRAALLLAVPAALGCGHAATLYRDGAPPVKARIVGGTEEAIVLEGDVAVPRSEVVRIHHAGRRATWFGAAIAGYGVGVLPFMLPTCQDPQTGLSERQSAACTAEAFVPLALGAAIVGWALAVRAGSVAAARDTTYVLPAGVASGVGLAPSSGTVEAAPVPATAAPPAAAGIGPAPSSAPGPSARVPEASALAPDPVAPAPPAD